MNGKYDLESKRQVATSKDLEVKESNWDDTWKTFLDQSSSQDVVG